MPRVFTFNPIVKKPYEIECFGNKCLKSFKTLILSGGLELLTKSVVKDYYIRLAFFILEKGPKGALVYTPLLP